jgi:hypothetical protein
MFVGPLGTKTKNDCAGKAQQQITRPDLGHSISSRHVKTLSLIKEEGSISKHMRGLAKKKKYIYIYIYMVMTPDGPQNEE